MRLGLVLAMMHIGLQAANAPAADTFARPPGWAGPTYADGVEGKLLLSDGWEFRADPNGVGDAEHWERPGVPGFAPTTVPGTYSPLSLPPDSFYGSVGWYRVTFDAPAVDREVGEWILRFESVNQRATVYLNGRALVGHDGGFTPWEVPLALHARDNTLVVRVDNHLIPGTAPGPTLYWWNWGGILREVYLRPVERVDVADVAITTPIRRGGRRAAIDARVTLANPTDSPQVVSLAATVRGVGARGVPAIAVPPQARAVRTVRIVVRRPRLWSPSHPHLYRLHVTARADGRVVAGWRAHVGVRRLRIRGREILLNGRRIRFFGVALHEMDDRTGGASTDLGRRCDLQLVRRLGADVIRSHYPLHPWTLEQADRLGILVWDEVPAYQAYDREMARADYQANAASQLQEMVRRDRNHPSVLTWSLGNEPVVPHGEGLARWIRRGRALVRAMDRTRPVSMGLGGNDIDRSVRAYRRLDLLGFNLYTGWYSKTPPEQTASQLRVMEAHYPGKPLVISEFGAEANFRSGPHAKGSYAYQRRVITKAMSAHHADRQISGSIVWVLRDFPVRYDWNPGGRRYRAPFNQKGLADQDGRPKPNFGRVAALIRSFTHRPASR